jgi:hypothetical protein
MSSTACDDQFTVGTQTIERIRAPYDPIAVLKRNVAALEVALKQQTERAEAAEAELAKLAQQSPIKYLYRVIDCFGHDVLRDDPKGATIIETVPLFAAPAPAVPAEWREAMQEAHDTFQRYADLHWAKDTRDSHEKAKVNQKLANKLYALLQSAEVRHD